MGDVVRVRGRDLASLEETWHSFVPTARVNRVDAERFRFSWESTTVPGLTALKHSLTADVRAAMVPEEQLFACHVTADGGLVRTAKTEHDLSRAWIAPAEGIDAEWVGAARVRGMIFDRARVERFARQITGDDRLRFEVLRPEAITSALSQAWISTFDYVSAGLSDFASDPSPLVEAEYRRHAMKMTLLTFGTSFLDAADRATQRRPADGSVRRATAFIDAHAHQPITVDDVARAVHLSTRGLQYAFARALGETPAVYLRRARLAGAHRDLVSGTGETVAVIGRRWGFAHPSRFARYFREEYGYSPGGVGRASAPVLGIGEAARG